MVPIERGGRFGISGNGYAQIPVRNVLLNAEDLSTLIMEMESHYLQMISSAFFEYFQCPDCNTPI